MTTAEARELAVTAPWPAEARELAVTAPWPAERPSSLGRPIAAGKLRA